jgi:hypothetical protein
MERRNLFPCSAFYHGLPDLLEKTVKTLISQANNEEGSVLVVALLLLVLLTIMGISATTTSNIEIQIAGNERFHKIALYHADSGVYTTPKLISACIDNNAEQTVASGSYTPSDGTFYREVMGFDTHDPATDVQFILAGFRVDVDVNRTGQESLAGGSAEFASGAEGIGAGSAGGVAILYEMNSLGTGPGASRSTVRAVYRKVLGVPGGL